MTTPALSIATDDLLYRAIGRMRRARLRHMPVVDAQGRPAGMLDLDDALAAAAARMVGQVDRLSRDDTTEGLGQAKRVSGIMPSDSTTSMSTSEPGSTRNRCRLASVWRVLVWSRLLVLA
jgi:signal-transduction protein with cAMP-binding, CBS, and nucleotidyltransferase domain